MVDKIRSTQIYNRGATGQFVAGNTFRPPTSGTRPKPVLATSLARRSPPSGG